MQARVFAAASLFLVAVNAVPQWLMGCQGALLAGPETSWTVVYGASHR
jgi:hypothetical protein